MPKGQLLTGDQARVVKTQHKSPCSDCPFARKSLAGWLGSINPLNWLMIIHGEGRIDCHTCVPMQCAGAAIFRANVCKSPRNPDLLVLKGDTIRVFSGDTEFLNHHRNGKAVRGCKGR